MSSNYPDNPRWISLIGLVALLFVTAGCLAPAGTEIDDSKAVAEHVESRYEALDGFQATMVRTVERGGHNNTTRASVAFEKGNYLRIAYRTGPKAGAVTVIDDPEPARRFANGAAETGRADASDVYGALAADLVDQNDVVYDGTSTVDGHRVAVYSLTPANRSGEPTQPRLIERRVSVDVDRMVPIQVESTWRADGQEITETIRFTDVTLRAPQTPGAGAQEGVAP